MDYTRSFRFADDDLNRRLIAVLEEADFRHSVDENEVIRYLPKDEESFENDFVGAIRDKVFTSWQVLTCPIECTDLYKQYMRAHEIPFKEEMIDGQLWFLLPQKYRPDRWNLDDELAAAPK